MTPVLNYSQYFQAQLQCQPRTPAKPVSKNQKITIRYKRTKTKDD